MIFQGGSGPPVPPLDPHLHFKGHGHVRIQEFSSGGSRSVKQKKLCCCFLGVFSVLSLFDKKLNGQFQRNLSFSRFQRGPKFSKGVQLFPGGGGGVQLLIPYRNPFPGGGGSGPPAPPPPPHLWIRNCN